MNKKYYDPNVNLKIDNKYDVPDDKYIVHENLLSVPFYCTCSAIGGSGKTVMALDLLRKYKALFKGKILIFTSSPSNTLYRFAKDLKARIFNKLVGDNGKDIIADLLQFQAEQKDLGKMEPVMILLDDFICNKVFNSRRSPIVDLFTKGRHFMISIMVLSQSYNLIPLPIRKLSMVNIFFNPFNAKETKTIVEENCSYLPEKEFEKMLLHTTKEKFQFLVCDYQKHRYLKNFDEILSSRF